MKNRFLAAAFVLATCCFRIALPLARAGTAEQNWAQWRGPLGTGVAPDANPPVTWSETNHIRWKVKIPGSGKGTPIIWDNKVFLQTAIPTGRQTTETPAAEPAQAPGPG